MKRTSAPMLRSQLRLRQEGGERKLKFLNREFEKHIRQLEESTAGLEAYDKELASQWISKLKTRTSDLVEAYARNSIVNYLLQLTNGQMFKRMPFSRSPPSNSFSDIRGMMPATRPYKQVINELYNDSPDAGAFLDGLPVPRDGAFFVIHLRPNFN